MGECKSVDGKLLRGSIRGWGNLAKMDLTEFFLKEARVVRCQLGAGEVDEEPYQICRVTRY